MKVAETAKENIVDLSPYINPSPYTVPANMPVSQGIIHNTRCSSGRLTEPSVYPPPLFFPHRFPLCLLFFSVFNLFRSMGLRHLIVINAFGDAVGMITRHNLTHEHLQNKWEFLKSTKPMMAEQEEVRKRD